MCVYAHVCMCACLWRERIYVYIDWEMLECTLTERPRLTQARKHKCVPSCILLGWVKTFGNAKKNSAASDVFAKIVKIYIRFRDIEPTWYSQSATLWLRVRHRRFLQPEWNFINHLVIERWSTEPSSYDFGLWNPVSTLWVLLCNLEKGLWGSCSRVKFHKPFCLL